MSTTDCPRTVTTQAELDQALADGVSAINIRSERGVWLLVRDTGSATVTAWDSSSVNVWGSATITARDSATVSARDTATVNAWDFTTVDAWGSSTITARNSATVSAQDFTTVLASDSTAVTALGSATVTASGSATVTAWNSATVNAWDFATVTAWDSTSVDAWDSVTVEAGHSTTVTAADSATIEARGSATVTALGSASVTARNYTTVTARDSTNINASDSATVEAWDSATVTAWGYSKVTASSRVAIHKRSGRSALTGGVIIDHTQNPSEPIAWCAWHDVPVTNGKAILHKAVGDDWTTDSIYSYQPAYTPGAELEAPDWHDDNRCGGGLHFSPRPWEAQYYYFAATRFVAVEVEVAYLRPVPGSAPKAKAPRCRVLYEVDINGRPVGGESDE